MTAQQINFNQSRIKSFLRCPKQYEYKYLQNLQPKKKSRPLFFGSWIHSCLETLYRDGDWHTGHQLYLDEWNKLFEEEQGELSKRFGPLPQAAERIMRSYIFYYKKDGWRPRFIEEVLEVETPLKLPNGKFWVFKGRLDLVVEDEDGLLWLVDHKTASTIPTANSFHAMDPQLMLYPWAAEIQFGIKIAGVIYNYVRSKPPTIPKLNKDGSLSRRKITTDYPTLYSFLKREGFDPKDFSSVLVPMMKKSPDFLRRYRLPREKAVTRNVLLDVLSTAKRIDETKRFVRNVTRDCSRICAYHDLCRAELNGFDTAKMREMMFIVAEEDYVTGDVVSRREDDFDYEGEEE